MSAAPALPLPQVLPQNRPCPGCASPPPIANACASRTPLLPHSPTPLPHSPFSPPESAILADLGRPDYTFRDIAEMHGTNADALTIWLTRPDIEVRLAAIESAIARRTRLIATNYLPSAVKTVTRILDEYNDEESHCPVQPGNLSG